MNNPNQPSLFDDAAEPEANVVNLAEFAERRTAKEIEDSRVRHPSFDATLPSAETIAGESEEDIREWLEMRAQAMATGRATVELSQRDQLRNARRTEKAHRVRVPKQIYDRG